MPSKTRTGLIALSIAAPIAAAIALFSNATAQGGELQRSPAFLMAQADTTDQDGMMGQGDMGGMMGQGDMGGMMDMMQQMSRMMATCNKMMETTLDDEQRSGGDDKTETPQQ